MAVYRIEVKKRVERHAWSNAYVVLTIAPYTRDELLIMADECAPRLVAFERHVHSEEVEITETITTALLSEATSESAYRPAHMSGRIGSSVQGLRPFAVEESTGPSITLVLGLQPISGHWGSKDYRYALGQHEVVPSNRGYHLRPDSLKLWQQILMQAKTHIQPLLTADGSVPSLAVSASRSGHEPQAYRSRYIRDLQIKGVHINKHRR